MSTPTPSDSRAAPTKLALPHLFVALGFVCIGVLGLWQTTVIPKAQLYAAVGPEFVPWIVSVMIIGLGIGLVIAAIRGGWAPEQNGTITEWLPLGFVLLGLVINAALIEYIGFILASTMMFALVARGFGSRAFLRDIGIGFSVAFISYVGFDRILGYKIGTGLIEKLI